MSDFNGKTALISGGAEGIGFSIASAMGAQGMNIVLGDVDQTQMALAEKKLKDAGVNVLALKMDVTDVDQWQQAVDRTKEEFGNIHMLVNNAGVATAPGPIEGTNYEDWQWVLDVNLMGVVKGAHIVGSHMKAHGEGGWMVNVASMAGMAGVPTAGSYTATKVAVVGMSESWQPEMAQHNIHVAVLCPAFVKTRIHLSGRNRNTGDQDTNYDPNLSGKDVPGGSLVENGIAPELVGLRVVEALEAKEFYIFTHPSHRESMQMRGAAIDQAFERAGKSPILEGIDDDPNIVFG